MKAGARSVLTSLAQMASMHLALDVYYGDAFVRGACVGFQRPEDAQPAFVIVEVFTGPAASSAPAGLIQTRELPYLERLVAAAMKRGSVPETILIDGYVWLGEGRPGLGHSLHEALGGRIPVIGVAKTRFQRAPAVEVRRGASASPLFVTAVGLAQERAENFVRSMHGPHRIPTLLGCVDRASREAG